MDEIRIVKMQLDLALKCAVESQSAYHHAVNMRFGDRHVGTFDKCQEDSCVQFRNAVRNIVELPKMYNIAQELQK